MPIIHMTLQPPSDPHEFEDLVTAVLRIRENNRHLVRFGRSGQRQHGIDGWDNVTPDGIVWQTTLQRTELLAKLVEDLCEFDANPSFATRSRFVFVTAVSRDARLQEALGRPSEERVCQRKCAVEPLFWDDLRESLTLELLQRYYSRQFPDVPTTAPIMQGMLLLAGWEIAATASLIEQRIDAWLLRLDEFELGTPADLAAFIERFEPGSDSTRASFEGLGRARTLVRAPELCGRMLRLFLGAVYEQKPRPDWAAMMCGNNTVVDGGEQEPIVLEHIRFVPSPIPGVAPTLAGEQEPVRRDARHGIKNRRVKPQRA